MSNWASLARLAAVATPKKRMPQPPSNMEIRTGLGALSLKKSIMARVAAGVTCNIVKYSSLLLRLRPAGAERAATVAASTVFFETIRGTVRVAATGITFFCQVVAVPGDAHCFTKDIEVAQGFDHPDPSGLVYCMIYYIQYLWRQEQFSI
jgi:hypothetical protein